MCCSETGRTSSINQEDAAGHTCDSEVPCYMRLLLDARCAKRELSSCNNSRLCACRHGEYDLAHRLSLTCPPNTLLLVDLLVREPF
jgi:hypothetical protein